MAAGNGGKSIIAAPHDKPHSQAIYRQKIPPSISEYLATMYIYWVQRSFTWLRETF
jgi:hypothetical protein